MKLIKGSRRYIRVLVGTVVSSNVDGFDRADLRNLDKIETVVEQALGPYQQAMQFLSDEIKARRLKLKRQDPNYNDQLANLQGEESDRADAITEMIGEEMAEVLLEDTEYNLLERTWKLATAKVHGLKEQRRLVFGIDAMLEAAETVTVEKKEEGRQNGPGRTAQEKIVELAHLRGE